MRSLITPALLSLALMINALPDVQSRTVDKSHIVDSASLAATAPGNVCWHEPADGPETCVPMSIIKSTFSGYREGDPSPLISSRQETISVQRQLADELKARRQCEGTLGPLQFRLHGELLDQQQQALQSAVEQAAPPGMVWSAKDSRYIPKPLTPDKPTEKPGTGRGGSPR